MFGKLKRVVRSLKHINSVYVYSLKTNSLTNYIQPKLNLPTERINEQNYYKVKRIRSERVVQDFQHFTKDKNNYGIYANYNKEPIGHAWLFTTNSKKIYNCYFPFKMNEGLIGYCYVDDNYRGNSIYPFLLSYLIRIAFQEKQIKLLYIDTHKKNISSQRGIEKVGFKKISRIHKILLEIRLLLYLFEK
jgi:RimJ/RimL family protein N-acetyltransferase